LARRARLTPIPRLKPPAPLSLGVAAIAFAALTCPGRAADNPDPDLVHGMWPAEWIACPDACPLGPDVYHFRKRLPLPTAPGRFVVRVSADNRFVLFVNGVRVGDGPARGDLNHWRFETYDIGPLLRQGDNLVAATVWNCGKLAPLAQMSDRTAFLVQGDSARESAVNTGIGWDVEEEKGQGFQGVGPSDMLDYYAAAPGEAVDGSRYDWDWQSGNSKGNWRAAASLGPAEPTAMEGFQSPYGTGWGLNRWVLVPDELPQMEYSETPIGRIVRTEGVGGVAGFPATIPAHAKASILVDRGAMTTAYPDLVVSRGKGAVLRITYAEALVDAKGHKGNRDEIANRSIHGLNDRFSTDGGAGRAWTTLWWRAWRYLQLDVETGDEALVIDSLKAHYSGYPFKERAAFDASDTSIGKIWETGTRTARMNAHETYMDCAYYEQLQYIGDTRIQALISYVEFGDDRLACQALDAYDGSRTRDGLTQSRYPNSVPQLIPPFSLLWIGMLHDYWLYRPDGGRLAEWVPHTRGVLDWYARHQRADGLLGLMPWWNYGDWTADFERGVPPQDGDGGSALLSLIYLAALRDGAELEAYMGNAAIAEDYRRRAEAVGKAVLRRCWGEDAGLLADTPARSHFSEQTNALGVLLDVVPKDRQEAVMRAVLSHKKGGVQPTWGEFSPASIYFRFYVARAMDHAGLGDLYLDFLGPWRRMLELGLTTWAETADPTRSDDHAWSAHPNYDLLTLVAGIRPASPGFRTVLVAPHPGALTSLSARMPHPAGDIVVRYLKTADAWKFDVNLPRGVSGTFQWGGQSVPLVEGPNSLAR
jgi:alpha-L-rhamnosidase